MARDAESAHQRRAELSQHFFRDPALAARMVAGLPLLRNAPVLEVGPGTGRLTEALADAGFRVIAIENDARLFRSLRARLIGRTNVELHHADALRFALPCGAYSVVSNVPFGVSSALMRRLLDGPSPPVDAFLIVQREAAEKYAGAPRETQFSLLHKPRYELRVLRTFRRADFEPPPRVRPVLLHVHRHEEPLLNDEAARRYASFVEGAFGGSPQVAFALRGRFTRVQLRRLSQDLGFALHAHPADLTFAQWLALFRFYSQVHMGRDPASMGRAAPQRFPLRRAVSTLTPLTMKEHRDGPRAAAGRR
jgi:23S rRNA (adenine-N6)-dimethyltransferase